VSGPTAKAPNEFSRIVTPDRLGAPKVVESLEASPAERAAVARRLGILAVDRLAAELTVTNLGDRLFRVEGRWEAAVQQACVVTLEPVPARLEGRLEASYEAGGDAGSGAGDEVLVDPEAEDPAEVLPAEGVDLGELVVQELAVALDPYPRAPGAELPAEYQPSGSAEDQGPFAALKALKVKK
jgi:uncharacterized metal-binding protein YceD (DUF177 family)